MYDKGAMNGADLITCLPETGATCPPDAAFEYIDPAEDAPYFFIAENYGFANRMFQSNQGPSFPAHQFIIGGTSQPSATSQLFAANNPTAEQKGNDGCDALPGIVVAMVMPNGQLVNRRPCFEHATLTDLIDAPPAGARQGISWRYYTPTEGNLWTAPNAIRHMCRPSGTPLACKGPD
jgi:hypothetical protein